MGKYEVIFKSKTMLGNFCQQKKLHEVFKEVRVEIHKNNKGTYVVLLTKEFLCAFGDV